MTKTIVTDKKAIEILKRSGDSLLSFSREYDSNTQKLEVEVGNVDPWASTPLTLPQLKAALLNPDGWKYKEPKYVVRELYREGNSDDDE